MDVYVFAYNIKIKRCLDNKEGRDFSVVIFQEKSFTRHITSGTKKTRSQATLGKHTNF